MNHLPEGRPALPAVVTSWSHPHPRRGLARAEERGSNRHGASSGRPFPCPSDTVVVPSVWCEAQDVESMDGSRIDVGEGRSEFNSAVGAVVCVVILGHARNFAWPRLGEGSGP